MHIVCTRTEKGRIPKLTHTHTTHTSPRFPFSTHILARSLSTKAHKVKNLRFSFVVCGGCSIVGTKTRDVLRPEGGAGSHAGPV